MTKRVSVHLQIQIKPNRCTYINVIGWSKSKKSGKAAIRYRKLKLHKNKQIDVGLQCALGRCLISVNQSYRSKERYCQNGLLACKNLNLVSGEPYSWLSSIRQDHNHKMIKRVG